MAVTRCAARRAGDRTRRTSRPVRTGRIRTNLARREDFRYRVADAAARVAGRTGVDPLDVRLALTALRDARLELLPQSVGIGAGLLAAAIAAMCVGFLLAEDTGPGYVVTGGFVGVAVLLAGGVAGCVVVARAARSRRPERDSYEDAWARLAVEVWPAPRYRSATATSGPAITYSRLEFVIAVRDGLNLDCFAGHAPFTRMP